MRSSSSGAVAPSAADPREVELEPIVSLDGARQEWTALAEGAGNVFSTWEWASTWWRHLARGRPLLATAVRRTDGRLLAILPLYRSVARPVRTVRFLGHGPGDQLGPICHAADRAVAADALKRLLAERRFGWDLFLGDELPATQGWGRLLGARILRSQASPVLRIDGTTWPDFIGQRSANFREQVRRRERKLAREHDLSYRLAGSEDRLEEDLDTLFALHRARWGGTGSDALAGAGEAFQREFAVQAARRGWLRLWFLELDGRPVAAWQGFRFAGAEWYYQSGRDPAWDREAVGFVLLVHSIRAAMADGMREYRLLRGGEPYKQRFANESADLETIGLSRGVAGGAALRAAALAGRLPPGKRGWLSKLAG